MQIHGFNKLTLLDYPKHMAATIFLGGCNLRCPFCHNASLVLNASSQPSISQEEVLATLSKRKGVLEGVCITGGEPTLYPDLPDLIQQIKALGYLVKLDTNGTNPSMIKSLVSNRLVDYIAMDVKNSKDRYCVTTGIKDIDVTSIAESIDYLLAATIDYEFRTTIVKEYHGPDEIRSLGEWLRGAKAYYLQSFVDSGDVIIPGLSSHSKDTLLTYISLLTPYIDNVSLRGVD
jgi:pyruvate formate lyase activating enzyme